MQCFEVQAACYFIFQLHLFEFGWFELVMRMHYGKGHSYDISTNRAAKTLESSPSPMPYKIQITKQEEWGNLLNCAMFGGVGI